MFRDPPPTKPGRWLAGQSVEVICDGGLVQIHHRGVLIATHARRHPLDKQPAGQARGRRLRPSRPTATAASVTRKVDSSGNVCFAGTAYRAGNKIPAPPGPSGGGGRHHRDLGRQRAHPLPRRCATTGPANTAPWPIPADGPTAPTPLNPTPGVRHLPGVGLSGGYRVLTALPRQRTTSRSGSHRWATRQATQPARSRLAWHRTTSPGRRVVARRAAQGLS